MQGGAETIKPFVDELIRLAKHHPGANPHHENSKKLIDYWSISLLYYHLQTSKKTNMRIRIACCTPLLLLIILIPFSCSNKQEKVDTGEKEAATVRKQDQKDQVPVIRIYCYGDAPTKKAEMLEKALTGCYPRVELMQQRLELPKEHYLKERNRYSGKGLLQDLSKLKEDAVALGITDKVIYQANEISPTFGIFGISFVGAKVALISLTQPSGKKHPDNHLVELMMHELGHAFGLHHCADEHCFMVDAEHGNKFSKTPSFCK